MQTGTIKTERIRRKWKGLAITGEIGRGDENG